MTYFIHMIMSCKQSYFLIRIGVHFPHSTSRTQRCLLLAILLQVTLARFSYPLVSIDHDGAFLLCHGQYQDSIRATPTSLTMRDKSIYKHACLIHRWSNQTWMLLIETLIIKHSLILHFLIKSSHWFQFNQKIGKLTKKQSSTGLTQAFSFTQPSIAACWHATE